MAKPEADYAIEWDDDEPLPPFPEPPKPRPVPAIAAKADRELAAVQAAAARRADPDRREDDDEAKSGDVVDAGDRVELLGKSFRIADRVGVMPLLKFASAADVDTTDPRALSAMYALLRDCIHAGTPGCGDCEQCAAGNDTACKAYDRGDWGAFEEHAMITKADADDLMTVVSTVLEIVTGRPTPPRAGSSAGPPSTRHGSTASSSGTRKRASRR
jgi:hypothetical protein